MCFLDYGCEDETHIANVNPIRYRGYFYDTETKLYYCNSRYYDPQIKRFINADVLLSTGTGFLGFNMFAYCENNPVTRSDQSGFNYFISTGGGGTGGSGGGGGQKPHSGHTENIFKPFVKAIKKRCDQLVNEVKKTADSIHNVLDALVASFEIKAGVGYGIGGSFNAGGFQANGVASMDVICVKMNSENTIEVGSELELEASAGNYGINTGVFMKEFHDYNCACYDGGSCTSDESLYIGVESPKIEFGQSFYFIVGGEYNISWDLGIFYQRLYD